MKLKIFRTRLILIRLQLCKMVYKRDLLNQRIVDNKRYRVLDRVRYQLGNRLLQLIRNIMLWYQKLRKSSMRIERNLCKTIPTNIDNYRERYMRLKQRLLLAELILEHKIRWKLQDLLRRVQRMLETTMIRLEIQLINKPRELLK